MRDGDTAFFITKDTVTKKEMTDENPDGNIVSPENVLGDLTATHKHEYISYAKDLGLKYSDFGILKTDYKNSTFNADALTPAGQEEVREFLAAWGTEIAPFAGGYRDKEVDATRMQELANNGEIKFSGLAVADVRVRDDNAYNGNGIDIPLTDGAMRDNAATLVFDQTGTQTLTADFSKDWYKIQAIKNADGKYDADFIQVVMWGPLAERLGNTVNKGQRILVEGRLQIRSYKNKFNETRWVTEVISNNFDYADAKPQPKADFGNEFGEKKNVPFDEEIPF